MAALFETFDPTAVEARSSFEPMPTGNYFAQIIDSEIKENKAGTGSYASLEFVILDGPYEGRKYWERLNLQNPNETAVKIARQALAEICAAVGLVSCSDTEQLHFKPLTLKLTCKARRDGQGMENTARFAALDGAAPNLVASTAKPAAAAAPKPAAATGGKPWERKKA